MGALIDSSRPNVLCLREMFRLNKGQITMTHIVNQILPIKLDPIQKEAGTSLIADPVKDLPNGPHSL